MKELVNLVGMSARKRVIESGRKPRILAGMSIAGERSSRRTSSGTIKELRFDMTPRVVPPDEKIKQRRRTSSASLSYTGSIASADASSRTSEPTWSRMPPQPNFTMTGTSSGSGLEGEEAEDYFDGEDEDGDTETETETEIPASPTPGPRPGSAMSMMSKRSQTPTVTMSYGTLPSSGSLNVGSGTIHRRNSGSYLTVPSVYSEPMPPVHTLISPTVAPQSPGRVRAGSVGNQEESLLSDGVFDQLDRRHTKLVEDISGIHKRLGELARQMG